MTNKIFWRSALKASLLTSFIVIVIGTGALFILGGSAFAEQLFDYIKATGKTDREAFSLLVGTLTTLQIFAWVLFAYLEEKIPFRQTLAKAALFNIPLTLVFEVLSQVYANHPLYLISSKALNNDAATAIFFIATTIGFAYFFDLFKKEEQKQQSGTPDVVLASIPRRAAALVIDSIIIGIMSLVVVLVGFGVGFASLGGARKENFFSVFSMLAGVLGITAMLISTAYWTVTEGKNGATPGKQLLKMKVVKENGEKIGYGEAFFRNVAKFYEPLQLFSFFDYLSVLFTDKKQRLLDKVVQTIVVRTDLKQEKTLEKNIRQGKASFGSRFAAVLIDQLLLLVLFTVLFLSAALIAGETKSENASMFVLTVLGFATVLEWAYEIYFVAVKNRTIGKQILGIKVCDTQGHTPPGWKKAIIRRFSKIISALPLLAGYLWMLVDENKQGWHDKLAGTFVVEDRKETFSSRKAFGALLAAYAIAGIIAGIIGRLLL